MKKIIILVSIFLIAGFGCVGSEKTTFQHPTQDEWLEVYTASNIRHITDLWEQRVAVSVNIFSKKEDGKPIYPKEFVVVIMSSNGQKMIAEESKQFYIDLAKSTVKSILEDYNIENDYKVTVQVPG